MSNTNIAIIANQHSAIETAKKIASHIECDFFVDRTADTLDSHPFALIFDGQKLYLQQTGRKAPGPIFVEFTEGAVDHRRKFGGGKGQMIAKAVGIKAGVYPKVLDATAGLGKDSFVLASLGSSVVMLERSPIAHSLLENGLIRARDFAQEQDLELLTVVNRMQLIHQSSHTYFSGLKREEFPDVIYLDPMFPEREKSAEVKKEMTAFHILIGKDEDADLLLPLALAHVNYRVVVKRPRKAPFLNNQTPSFQLEGKSSRFDIYTVKKMPEKLTSS